MQQKRHAEHIKDNGERTIEQPFVNISDFGEMQTPTECGSIKRNIGQGGHSGARQKVVLYDDGLQCPVDRPTDRENPQT